MMTGRDDFLDLAFSCSIPYFLKKERFACLSSLRGFVLFSFSLLEGLLFCFVPEEDSNQAKEKKKVPTPRPIKVNKGLLLNI